MGIPYRSEEHEAAATMEDCKVISEKLHAPFCKTSFCATDRRQSFSCCS